MTWQEKVLKEAYDPTTELYQIIGKAYNCSIVLYSGIQHAEKNSQPGQEYTTAIEAIKRLSVC